MTNFLDTIKIGTGTWAWGDRIFWQYGQNYSVDDLRAVFDVMINSGFRYFDTAAYFAEGRAESFIGEFRQAYSETHDQSPLIIIGTKFQPYPWHIGARRLRASLDKSIQRLQVPKVALFQLDPPLLPSALPRLARALVELKEAGKIEEIGVCGFSLERMIQFHELLSASGHRLASNQVTINLLKRNRLEEGLIEAGKRMGIRIIARSPLARGILTGKYTPQTLPIGVRARKYSKNELQKVQPLLLTLQTIGAAHAGKTITQTALNWVICKGALPVPGAKTPGQALENIGAVGWQLAAEEVEVLDQISLKVIKELKNER